MPPKKWHVSRLSNSAYIVASPLCRHGMQRLETTKRWGSVGNTPISDYFGLLLTVSGSVEFGNGSRESIVMKS